MDSSSKFSRSIVKYFPTGYIVHKNSMERFLMPSCGYSVIDHCGVAEDGIEVYISATGVVHKTMQLGIKELRELRGY